MATYDLARIMSQIEKMEKGLAVLKRQAAEAIKAQGRATRPVADTGTGRMNGYTLYVKEGGKRSNWKGLGERTKAKYSKRAKKINGGGAPPQKIKGLEEIVGVWNDDEQTFKRPKGRPPKDSSWNAATGKYEKKERTAKGKYEKKSNKCMHVFKRGGKVHKKGSTCGAKCSGSYCTLHARQHEEESESESELESESESEEVDDCSDGE